MVFLGGRGSESAMGVSGIYAGRGGSEVLDRVNYSLDIGRMAAGELERQGEGARRVNPRYTPPTGGPRRAARPPPPPLTRGPALVPPGRPQAPPPPGPGPPFWAPPPY